MFQTFTSKCLCLFLLLLWMKMVEPASNTTQTKDMSNVHARHGKIFSLFSIVQFKNAGCRSQSSLASGQSTYRNGTCYTSSECASKGGSASGNCASGFGVCCLFLYTASGSAIAQNCSYIQNPGFPSAYTGTNAISYTIQKCSTDVCYLRLDFESFTLLGPADSIETNGGQCSRDAFKVTTTTGTGNNIIPTICGWNTGQHIYVDIGNQGTDTANLAFTFTTTTTTRNWEIKVTQVECSNPGRPPNGCLQYWSTLSGRITTFNFLQTSGTTHLANQDVTVCIRRQDGYCCIQYQVCAGVINAFSLSTSSQTAAEQGNVDTQCTNDYVTIPSSGPYCSQAQNTVNSKYCSPYLNPFISVTTISVPICDCTAPFIVHFHTDAAADGNIASSIVRVIRGDCLDFIQIPCTGN